MKNIFISYCHEPLIYKEAIHVFVDILLKNGLPVVIDRYDLSPGHDLDFFMREIVNKDRYEKILVFCTAEYKRRADNQIGGVGMEAMTYRDIIKDNPSQEYVIPVIIEPIIDPKELLPNIFPPNAYYVDISNDLKFCNQASLDLIHYLQGAKPIKPTTSVLESLVTYSLANFPGLPRPLTELFKEEMSKWIVSSFMNSYGVMIKFNTWINLDDEYETLKRIAPNIVEFSSNLINPYVATDLLSIFWKYFDNIPNNPEALKAINKAISIIDSTEEDNLNIRRIKLNLEFRKAITLHRMDDLDVALEIYNKITINESQDILDPITVFTSALYAGHIYKIKKDIPNSTKSYNEIINSCEYAYSQSVPLDILNEIRNIQYVALNSIENKTEEHERIIERNRRQDLENTLRHNTMSNSLYPMLFAMPIKLIPS